MNYTPKIDRHEDDRLREGLVSVKAALDAAHGYRDELEARLREVEADRGTAKLIGAMDGVEAATMPMACGHPHACDRWPPDAPDAPPDCGWCRDLAKLREAEQRRDAALADYTRVLAEKRDAEMRADAERQTIEWIESEAAECGYDNSDEGAESIPDFITRICRERDEARAKYAGLQRSVDAGLNSGDGRYRP